MSKRRLKNWLQSFVQYASIGEAPLKMYFWTGISTVAGALRRRVWVDQPHYQWTPNCYVILVAPPGIISKSTTANVGMNLLRKVPGINFGPKVITWQKLVEDMAKGREEVLNPEDGAYYPMSCMTIPVGELGTFLDPSNRDMVDVLVDLWDGQVGSFDKATKSSGSDTIENPWINILACTTPDWLAGNFPEYMIGGGFTSRCIFVFGKKKRQLVAYPGDHIPPGFQKLQEDLIHDLELISLMVGDYKLDSEAKEWGKHWYENHWNSKHKNLPLEQFGGYLARKQTHIHKVAMIMAASESDELILYKRHLIDASEMVDSLEDDMPYVFDKIGRSAETQILNNLVEYVFAHGAVPEAELFRIMSRKCTIKDYNDILQSAIKAGFVTAVQAGDNPLMIKANYNAQKR